MPEPAAGRSARSLRRDFLLDPEVTFLNHGSFGACPEPVMQTFEAWSRELEREPVEFMLRRAIGLVRTSTEALAEYVGCNADELVLVPNATFAMNMVARSLPADQGRQGSHDRPRVRRDRPLVGVGVQAHRRGARALPAGGTRAQRG